LWKYEVLLLAVSLLLLQIFLLMEAVLQIYWWEQNCPRFFK
jgi:hypothetical protein